MLSVKRASKPLLFVDAEGQVRAMGALEPGVRVGRSSPVQAVVSDHSLRWLNLPWNADLLDEQSATAQFDLHAELLFGKEASGLVYAQAYAPFGQPQCVAGLPVVLLEEIRAFARDRKLEVVSLRPLSTVCWASCRAAVQEARYLFVVIQRSAVTALIINNGRVERVASRGCLDNPVGELETMWRRMRLREPDLAAISAMYAFDLTGGASEQAAAAGFTVLSSPDSAEDTETPELAQLASANASRGGMDFLASAAPVSGWRSASLIAGLACLALFGARAGLAYMERAALQSDIAERSAESSASVPTSSGDRQRTRAQVRSVNQAITALNLPVGALLRNIQPPGELHTALVGLDLSDIRSDTHTAAVKITAESRTSAGMTAYVEYLSRAPIFNGVFLTRHEIVEARAGRPYRYEVEAAWRQ